MQSCSYLQIGQSMSALASLGVRADHHSVSKKGLCALALFTAFRAKCSQTPLGKEASDGPARPWRASGDGGCLVWAGGRDGRAPRRCVNFGGLGDWYRAVDANLSDLAADDAVDCSVAGRAGGGDPGAIGASIARTRVVRAWFGCSGGRPCRRSPRGVRDRWIVRPGRGVVRGGGAHAAIVLARASEPADVVVGPAAGRRRCTATSESLDTRGLAGVHGGCRGHPVCHGRGLLVQRYGAGGRRAFNRPGALDRLGPAAAHRRDIAGTPRPASTRLAARPTRLAITGAVGRHPRRISDRRGAIEADLPGAGPGRASGVDLLDTVGGLDRRGGHLLLQPARAETADREGAGQQGTR